MKRSFLLFIIVFGLSLLTKAQPVKYRFTHLETSDGVANNEVNDIIQDSKGFIWIATQNGLQRYDGHRFLNYQFEFDNDRSLPSDNASKLLEDDKGNIWVACDNGVAVINQFRQKPLRIKLGSKERELMEVTELFMDSRKNIWLACRPYGVFIYDKALKQFIEASKVLPAFNWTIHYVAQERQSGNFWFGCDSGLAYYDVKRQRIYNHKNNSLNLPLLQNSKLYGVSITGLHIDPNNSLFCNTFWSDYPVSANIHFENYQYEINSNQLKTYTSPVFTNHNYYSDRHANTWLLANGLLAEKQGDRFVSIYIRSDDPYGFKAKTIHCLYEDSQHNYWVGTEDGVYIFNREKEKINRGMVLDEKGDPIDAEVVSFLGLQNGNIWVATWGNGIYEYDNQFRYIRQYHFRDNIDNTYEMVWCLYKARDGKIWIGCQAGKIMVYDPVTSKFIKLAPKAFDFRTVRTITEDLEGNIWFGTQHGYLIKYNPVIEKFIRFTPRAKPDLLGNIHQLTVDSHNNLWVSTASKGLLKVDPGSGKILETFQQAKSGASSLSGVSSNGIVPYNDSIIMIASLSLNVLNTQTHQIQKITTRDGLPTNAIASLQKDRAGNIWAGLSGAVVKIGWPSKKIEVYGKEDGVLNNSFQVNGMELLQDGRVVAGTTKDFIYFHPRSLQSSNAPPDVKITGLNVFQHNVNVDSVLNMEDKLRLSYDQSFVTIQFSSLTYLDDKFTYYYKLEGLDNDWIKATGFSASYNHLNGGNYTFLLKCENSEGLQSKNISALKIYIRPPFWETWWFFFLLAAITAGVLYLIHHSRINQLIDMQKVRSRIARDLHDDMGSTLSTINILSEMAKMRIDKDVCVTKEYLSKISDNSSRMMEAMDDIVWSINPINDNMQKITARMREYATNLFEAKDIEYSFHVDEGVKQIRLDMEARRDFFLIFKEAINNLVKYSQCKHAFVKIEIYEYTMIMKIIDDGVGFDVTAADNGNGLSNMQKRAQSLNSILNIESKLNVGTKVVLEVKFA